MRRLLLSVVLLLAVLLTFTATASAQELILRGAVEADQAHESEPADQVKHLPPMEYSHPTVSADGRWGGLMTSLTLVFFGLAALIGVLTDIDRSYDTHRPHGNDDEHAGHGHHDAAAHAHHDGGAHAHH